MVREFDEVKQKAIVYLDLVKKGFLVKEAFIFGSYAAGRQTEDSDIDIAIVSPDFDAIPDLALEKILWKMARHIDTAIEPIPLTIEEMAHPQLGSLANEIKLSGIKIYPPEKNG